MSTLNVAIFALAASAAVLPRQVGTGNPQDASVSVPIVDHVGLDTDASPSTADLLGIKVVNNNHHEDYTHGRFSDHDGLVERKLSTGDYREPYADREPYANRVPVVAESTANVVGINYANDHDGLVERKLSTGDYREPYADREPYANRVPVVAESTANVVGINYANDHDGLVERKLSTGDYREPYANRVPVVAESTANVVGINYANDHDGLVERKLSTGDYREPYADRVPVVDESAANVVGINFANDHDLPDRFLDGDFEHEFDTREVRYENNVPVAGNLYDDSAPKPQHLRNIPTTLLTADIPAATVPAVLPARVTGNCIAAPTGASAGGLTDSLPGASLLGNIVKRGGFNGLLDIIKRQLGGSGSLPIVGPLLGGEDQSPEDIAVPTPCTPEIIATTVTVNAIPTDIVFPSVIGIPNDELPFVQKRQFEEVKNLEYQVERVTVAESTHEEVPVREQADGEEFPVVEKRQFAELTNAVHQGLDPLAAPYAGELDNLPTYDGNVPTYDGNVPTYDGNAPTYDGNAPTYDGNAPTYDGNAPTYDGNAPTYDGTAPTYDGNAPTYDGNAPTYDGNVPTYDGNVPTYDGKVPTYDGKVPVDGPGYLQPTVPSVTAVLVPTNLPTYDGNVPVPGDECLAPDVPSVTILVPAVPTVTAVLVPTELPTDLPTYDGKVPAPGPEYLEPDVPSVTILVPAVPTVTAVLVPTETLVPYAPAVTSFVPELPCPSSVPIYERSPAGSDLHLEPVIPSEVEDSQLSTLPLEQLPAASDLGAFADPFNTGDVTEPLGASAFRTDEDSDAIAEASPDSDALL